MKWYVLYTKSRNEKAVAQKLTALGIEVYCPVVRTRRQWSDRVKWVEEPLFRSICFVHIAEQDRERVFQISGVVRYLFWIGKPAVVLDHEIEQLKLFLENSDHNEIRVVDFTPQQRVRITSGILSEKEAVVVRQVQNKLVLRLETIGLQIQVNLNKTKVDPVN
ncbi:MAG TPA: UpxY family transcription antiterminator [Sphingobacteriaceae bacterium]|nr:UpxY family transcription antiterminator [Sphingobacteriaceae bacterium]